LKAHKTFLEIEKVSNVEKENVMIIIFF